MASSITVNDKIPSVQFGGWVQRKIILTAASVIDFTFSHFLGYKAIMKIQTSARVTLVRQGRGEMVVVCYIS